MVTSHAHILSTKAYICILKNTTDEVVDNIVTDNDSNAVVALKKIRPPDIGMKVFKREAVTYYTDNCGTIHLQ